MSTNYFTTPLKPYGKDGERWPINGMFESFFGREFENVPKENLSEFLKSGLDRMNPNGLVSLLPDDTEGCDGDVRIDLVYTPSCAVAAIGIYLLLKDPSSVSDTEKQKLQILLNRIFSNGVAGHGYGADEYRRKILCMFALTGAKSLIDRYPDFCPQMKPVLTEQLELVRKRPEGEPSWTNPRDLTGLSIQTIAAWNGNTEPVFVYGTLMQGESAHSRLADAVYAGKAILRGYAVYSVSWYPGIVPEEKEAVLGELYYVSKQMIPGMDEYEGEGTLYQRKTVTVETQYGKKEAYAYIYLQKVSGDPIRGGRWAGKENDPVWYACYGSNLREERFKDYIVGNEHPRWGKPKKGCTDKTLWTDSMVMEYPGQLYFGNSSSQWQNMGVAFYDPDAEGKTYMRLYRITFGQLLEVWKQEGSGENWYDSLYPVEITKEGIPVYTISSKKRKAFNLPDEQYLEVIRDGLVLECGIGEKAAKNYLKQAQKRE
ncbi:MAG: gamma-glutamylcyclotransferase [Clostridia bacterium]|nr:gamma-glutamylcyclotransferase [Clostridia bacterium]